MTAESVLQELHAKFQSIRQSEYGNVHFTLHFLVKASNGYHEEKRYHYWARDDRYYRIDEETIVDGAVTEKLRRIIRPEGYAVLRETENGYAIVNFDTKSEGLEHLLVQDYYCASTRSYLFIDAEVPWGVAYPIEYSTESSKRQAGLFNVLSVSRMDEKVVLTSRCDVEIEGSTNRLRTDYRTEYDLKEGVVLSYEQMSYTKGMDDYEKDKFTKTYDFKKLKHIPKTIARMRQVDGIQEDLEYVVESIDWSPVPMGIFAFDAQDVDRGSVWVRRAWMFGLGLAVLVAYIVYRRLSVS